MNENIEIGDDQTNGNIQNIEYNKKPLVRHFEFSAKAPLHDFQKIFLKENNIRKKYKNIRKKNREKYKLLCIVKNKINRER